MGFGIRGTGPEFDLGQTIEACLTHHPNPPTPHSVPAPNLPARNRTTAIILICKAAVEIEKLFVSFRLPESVISRTWRFGGREPTLGRSARRPRGRPAPTRDPGRPLSLAVALCAPAHFAAALTFVLGRSRLAGAYCACRTAIGRTSNKSAAARLGPVIVFSTASMVRIAEKPSANTDAFQAWPGGHRRPPCVARPNSRPLTTITAFRSPSRANATISPRFGPTTASGR